MPDTIGTAVAFLLLVAPGILWETLRERRHPQRDRTSFREVGVVALASTLFSMIATVLVLAGSWIVARSQLDALGRFIQEGTSAPGVSPFLPATFLAIGCSTALALVLLADRVFGTRLYGAAELRPGSIWVAMFRTKLPADAAAIATIHLHDGSWLRGHVAYFSVDDDVDKRELTLAAPISRRGPGAAEPEPSHHQFVVIRSSEIAYLDVDYVGTAALAAARG